MKDNTVNVNGIDVYTHKIYELADEYIYNLSDDPEEIKTLKHKTPVFKGMLKYIYINLFKPNENTKTYNNIKQNSNVDYGDIKLLDGLWDIYTQLCYSHFQTPILLNFSIMTGISMDWFEDCAKGNIRGGSDGATSEHSRTVKKWMKECEAGAYEKALEGNPGGMFVLKANYGYSEQPQRIEIVGNGAPQESREQIAARYAGYIGAQEPEKPDLE